LCFLVVATQDAIASTLVNDGPRFAGGHGCVEPLSVDVWLDGGGGVGVKSNPRPLDLETIEGTATDGIAIGHGRVLTAAEVEEEELFGSPSGAEGEVLEGIAINGIAESLEGRGPANDGIAMDGIIVGPALDELEFSPSGGPVERDCRNPYPGSGRLNTLAPD